MEGRPINVLIADDMADVVAPCLQGAAVGVMPLNVVTARTPPATLEVAARESFDVIFLDINFESNDRAGIALLPLLVKQRPEAKIVMLSVSDDGHTIAECMDLGATEFCSKRCDGRPEQLLTLIREHIEAVATPVDDHAEGRRIAELVGAGFCSPAMADVFAQVALARRLPGQPVLITGETGAGKEVIARAINIATGRNKVDVDCGAIQESLAESEFFGHKRGAFTGADTSKLGLFQRADKGDLFLDEVGNLKLSLQEKLLRAIQEDAVTPVGGTATQRIDVRVIAATNADLDAMVRQGAFRQDLLQRIRGVWIHIPPLRDRPEDITPLAESFAARHGLKVMSTCVNYLKSYSWPGNARELENLIEVTVGSARGKQIGVEHLPKWFRDKVRDELKAQRSQEPEGAPDASADGDHKAYQLPLVGTYDEVKDFLLKNYLVDRFRRLGAGANKSKLANDLSISRNSLNTYLTRLAIELPDEEVNP